MNINGSKILSELTEVNNQLNTSDIYKLIDLIDRCRKIWFDDSFICKSLAPLRV